MNRVLCACLSIAFGLALYPAGAMGASLSDNLGSIIDAYSGTWSSVDPIDRVTDEEGEARDVRLLIQVARVELDGADHALYVEMVRSDAPWEPVEQAVVTLHDTPGGVVMRQHVLRFTDSSMDIFDGLGAAPSAFPALSLTQLVATHDLGVTKTGKGFVAETEHPFPINDAGAAEALRTIECAGNELRYQIEILRASDTPGADTQEITLERADPYAVAEHTEDGLIVVDYPTTMGDDKVQDGDIMAVHYRGFIEDSSVFDESYKRGQPYGFRYPPGNSAIVGWGRGMVGYTLGARRKLVIPGPLGYGERGNPMASIPGNATLYFNTHCVEIQHPGQPAQRVGSDADGAQRDERTRDD